MNNVNKFIFLTSALLLTGCFGFMDRLVESEHTTAVIKNNQVCAISPLQPNQRIIAVQIKSNKSNILREIFADKPIYVAKGDCLPLFNITPQPGLRYSIAWDIRTPNKYAHLVETRFSITIDSSGNLKIQ